MDYDIYLKCENLQYTGSGAERGALNALLALEPEARSRGVVVPSNGNLALAAAYHGKLLGISVVAVLPERTPMALSQRCSRLGAEVVRCGESVRETRDYALKVQRETGRTMLRSDSPLVMAGMGSAGAEVVKQLPRVDAVIVPAAAGGMLAATLVACKALKPSCLVYGAECSKVPKVMKALQAGAPVSVAVASNLAEGLNSPQVGANAFATIRGRLDRMLEVDEREIARAMVSMVERERLVADGAGVCAVAAVMQGLVPELKGKSVVCMVSGGNVDCGRLTRGLQRGLSASGRLVRFAAPLAERPDGLQRLADAIAAQDAVLKSVVTERAFDTRIDADIAAIWANVLVETANEEHTITFKNHIRTIFPSARFAFIDFEDQHRFGIQ